MKKYFVRIGYPDLLTEGQPIIQSSFILWGDSGAAVAYRAFRWGVTIVVDMLKQCKSNPFEAELAAEKMVEILSVKHMEG